jgi:hypothetical protein
VVGGEKIRRRAFAACAVLAASVIAAWGPSFVAAESQAGSARLGLATIRLGHPGAGGGGGCHSGDYGDRRCPTAKEADYAGKQFATIWVYKIIDLDGDPYTDSDSQDVGGWEFSLDIVGGQIGYEEPVTQEGGGAALFSVSFDQSPASVLVSEELDGRYEFVDAACLVQGPPEFVEVGAVEGAGIRFDVEGRQEVICTFLNAPTELEAPSPSPEMPDTALVPLDSDDGRGTSSVLLVFLGVAAIAGVGMLIRPTAIRRPSRGSR